MASVDISNHLYDEWIKGIQEDNGESVGHIIQTSDNNIKEILLWGNLPKRLFYDCRHCKAFSCYPFYIKQEPRSSLHIAVYLCARNATKVLIHHGVDVLSKSSSGCNILHILIHLAYYRTGKREDYFRFFKWLLNVLEMKNVRILLSQTDPTGLLPLELTAQLGLNEIFMDIMNTREVYLYREKVGLLKRSRWYDITDYEPPYGSRGLMSPINLISTVSHHSLTQTETKNFLSSQIVQNWFAKKYQIVKNFLIFSFSFHIIKLILTFLVSFSSLTGEVLFPSRNIHVLFENTTLISSKKYDCHIFSFDNKSEISISVLLLLICLYSIGCNICILLRLKGLYRTRWLVLRKEYPAVNMLSYQWIDLTFNALTILRITVIFGAYFSSMKPPIALFHVGDIILAFLIIWSYMFWIQLTPFGHFIVMVQRTLFDLCKFLIVFVVFQCSFALCFFMNLTNYATDCEKGFPGFTNMLDAFFSICQIMLNTISITDFETNDPYTLKSLHIIYVTLIPILLLNLFIATLSESVARMSPCQNNFLTIQRHMIALHTELYFSGLFSGYYRHRLEKILEHENGRYYLVVSNVDSE